jgi:hypothetical protein
MEIETPHKQDNAVTAGCIVIQPKHPSTNKLMVNEVGSNNQ